MSGYIGKDPNSDRSTIAAELKPVIESNTMNVIDLWKNDVEVAGYKLAGTFESGCVLKDDSQVVVSLTRQSAYRWTGQFPVDTSEVSEDNPNWSYWSPWVSAARKCADLKNMLQKGQTFGIACFGDSTMWGANVPNLGTQDVNNAPKVLGLTLNLLYGVNIVPINRAVSGTTIRQMMTGTDGRGATYHYDITKGSSKDATVVYCNHGINDSQLNGSISQFRADYERFVTVTRGAGKIPVIVTPNPNPIHGLIDETKSKRLEAFVNVMRDVARSMDVDLVDQYYYFIKTAERIPMTQLVPDGAHPSTDAYLQAGRNLAIPLVSAQTIGNPGDIATLDNVSFYTNATKNKQFQNRGSRTGTIFSCEREGQLTGISYPVILDRPHRNIYYLGLQWSNGARVVSGKADAMFSSIDMGVAYGLTEMQDWDRAWNVEVGAMAGLNVFSLLFEMNDTRPNANGMAFSGIGIPEVQFATYSSVSIVDNRKDVMMQGRLLSCMHNFIEGNNFTLKDKSGHKVQSIEFSNGSVSNVMYRNGAEANRRLLHSNWPSGVYPLEIRWRPDGTIDVAINNGIINASIAAVPGSLPNCLTPMGSICIISQYAGA